MQLYYDFDLIFFDMPVAAVFFPLGIKLRATILYIVSKSVALVVPCYSQPFVAFLDRVPTVVPAIILRSCAPTVPAPVYFIFDGRLLSQQARASAHAAIKFVPNVLEDTPSLWL